MIDTDGTAPPLSPAHARRTARIGRVQSVLGPVLAGMGVLVVLLFLGLGGFRLPLRDTVFVLLIGAIMMALGAVSALQGRYIRSAGRSSPKLRAAAMALGGGFIGVCIGYNQLSAAAG